MARSRNIKPGFFVNADLVELPPLVRLLFIGLWTLADREGRLEDRPAQIKMQVLPGDDIDTGQALDLLGASTFITRYEVGGKRYIQISNFGKHQNPHVKEPKSVIPPLDVNAKVPEIKKGNTKQIPASCKHRTCLVLAGLIPDSLLLIPSNNLSASTDAVGVDEPGYLETRKKRKLTGKRLESFQAFWEAFDYKKGKAEAADSWLDIPQLTSALVAQIVAAAKREALVRPGQVASGKTPKMAQGWLSARRWEDEAVELPKSSSPASAPYMTEQDRENIRRARERVANE